MEMLHRLPLSFRKKNIPSMSKICSKDVVLSIVLYCIPVIS